MPQEKVDASRHNTRVAPRNNPSSGSNQAAPPFFDGGGGSPINRDQTDLVGKPPPIKKEGRDFCPPGRCSSTWNTHHNKVALKLHLGYMFGISWPVVSTILKDYSIDHINQNIHETKRFVKEELARGRTIETYAGCFIHQLQGSFEAEPELSPEAMRERDVTRARDLELLRKPRKPAQDDGQKYLDEKKKRRG